MKDEVFEKLLAHIRIQMSWNICKDEDVRLFTEEETKSYAGVKNGFSYSCYPGSSIITEMREAVKLFDPKLKVITLDFTDWGDMHEYEFSVLYRVGQEPDEPIEDDTDYQEASFKSDKYLENLTPEQMQELDEIDSVVDMVDFLETHANDRIYSYIGNGSIKGLAEYMISERTAMPGTEGEHQMN